MHPKTFVTLSPESVYLSKNEGGKRKKEEEEEGEIELVLSCSHSSADLLYFFPSSDSFNKYSAAIDITTDSVPPGSTAAPF